MTSIASPSATLKFLEDRWDPAVAATLDEPELLRYRSNLLGSDLRITNFAGGNTSSKVSDVDPLTGEKGRSAMGKRARAATAGSMKRAGLATLTTRKSFSRSKKVTKAWTMKTTWWRMYPLCGFRNNPVAASIDTLLHGRFFPSPTSIICIRTGASHWRRRRTAKRRWMKFNREFGHKLVWDPLAASGIPSLG